MHKKNTLAIWLAVFAGALFFIQASAQETRPIPPARPRMGINLAGVADWATELPFVDMMRTSRDWISQRKGEGWGKGPPLKLDENGWVKEIEPECFVQVPFATGMKGHFPSGQYTVLYDGEGEIEFTEAATISDKTPGRITLDVDSSKDPIWMTIRSVTPGNYIRNIRVIMPGFESTYEKQPFHPIFLDRWKGMAALRFMDWMATNNSKVQTWANRPKVTDANWSHGVPLEVMIDLCNRLKADPWFCIPHLADDDYVRHFAAQVKRDLDPSLKVHVEYSNEVWNTGFEQARWAQVRAKELGLGDPARPWEGGANFYARRSVQIFKIWEEVFGGANRLVRTIAWQAASDGKYWTDGMVLSFEEAYKHTDALAIAPYMTFCVPESSDNPKTLAAKEVAAWTVDQVLDHLEQVSLPESIGWIQAQSAVAQKYGLRLIAYEGGQHAVGVAGGENNEALTKLFLEANRHPRMGEIYRKYFAAWEQGGGDLMAVFSSIGRWNKWGSWGLAEYYDQKPADMPKYRAAMEWAKSKGQEVNLEWPIPKPSPIPVNARNL